MMNSFASLGRQALKISLDYVSGYPVDNSLLLLWEITEEALPGHNILSFLINLGLLGFFFCTVKMSCDKNYWIVKQIIELSNMVLPMVMKSILSMLISYRDIEYN